MVVRVSLRVGKAGWKVGKVGWTAAVKVALPCFGPEPCCFPPGSSCSHPAGIHYRSGRCTYCWPGWPAGQRVWRGRWYLPGFRFADHRYCFPFAGLPGSDCCKCCWRRFGQHRGWAGLRHAWPLHNNLPCIRGNTPACTHNGTHACIRQDPTIRSRAVSSQRSSNHRIPRRRNPIPYRDSSVRCTRK